MAMRTRENEIDQHLPDKEIHLRSWGREITKEEEEGLRMSIE